MMKLTNAPFLKEQNSEPYDALTVLAGSEAWQMWSNGNGEGWKLLAEAIGTDYTKKPVILGDEQLKKLNTLRIAPEGKKRVDIYQFGELSDSHLDAIVLNLAQDSPDVEIVTHNNNIGDKVKDLSSQLEKIKQNDHVSVMSAKDSASKVTIPALIKDKDSTNIKAKAFVEWLSLDLALNRESNNIYSYNGLIWELLEDKDLTYKAVEFFEENQASYSAKGISSVIDTAKIQLPLMRESKNFLSFKNGSLNRDTFEFKPHSREDYLTSVIPYDYLTTKQDTPLFDKWLDFVSEGKTEKKYNLLAALYMILTNRHNWQLFIEITGKGGSGKSVFAEIAAMLAGRENTESARLQDFDDPKERTPLYGKTLIVCPEQSRYGGDGSGLKSITGGDALAIEPKYKNKFKSIIPAVILIVNNEPTRFTERAGGIERRRVIFSFNQVVPEQERDPDFVKKLESEISGIIFKLLNTFQNPLEAKVALESQKNSDEALEVKKHSDHITAFCEFLTTLPTLEGMFIGNGKMLQNKAETHLYPAYLVYIGANNINGGLTLNNFSEALNQGLEQNKVPYPMEKRKTKNGVKTNVVYKDFQDFYAQFVRL